LLHAGRTLGGGANYVLEVLRCWDRWGVDYRIYAQPGYAEALLGQGLDRGRVRQVEVGGPGSGPLFVLNMTAWYSLMIRERMRREGVEIVFQPDMFGALLGRWGMPSVTAVHGVVHWFFPRLVRSIGAYYRLLYRRLLRSSDRIIAVSASTLRDLVQALKVDPERIRLVYNGVDCGLFHPGAALTEAELARLGVRRPYVIYVGTGGATKNVVRAVRAFAGLRARYPHQLVLCGASRSESVRRAVAQAGIEDRVTLLDHQPRRLMPGLYAASDGFLFPSLYEGHSLALLEAMASGCAIVTSRFGSTQETVGCGAVCVNPYEEGAIREGLGAVLGDEQLRTRLGRVARQTALRFGWEACARGTLDVVEGLWRERSRRRG